MLAQPHVAGDLALARDEDLTSQRTQRPQLGCERRELSDGVVELDLGTLGVCLLHVVAQRLQIEERVVDVRDELIALMQDDPRLGRRRFERLIHVHVPLHVEVARAKVGAKRRTAPTHRRQQQPPV
eukprot:6341956-Prymnesium_polylepis.1